MALECSKFGTAMRYLGVLILVVLAFAPGAAQPLSEINFSYLYNPAPVRFSMNLVSQNSGTLVLYQLKDIGKNYVIEWELRKDINDSAGMAFSPEATVVHHQATLVGSFLIPRDNHEPLIAAKVKDPETGKGWFYYASRKASSAVNGYLRSEDGTPELQPFTYPDKNIEPITEGSTVFVTYYDKPFPPADLPFPTKLTGISPNLVPDTTFQLKTGTIRPFSETGLYLVQSDTTSGQGFTFLVQRDYPRYNTIANLIGPLKYLCTKPEYDQLTKEKPTKQTFDKIILQMTGDPEAARTLVRNYFRRVERANEFFTSYKEGWKTDRGMMYIIFGPPDEVYRTEDRELWKYTSNFSFECSFVHLSSLFDPENYILIRERKIEYLWYQTVDSWRHARFK